MYINKIELARRRHKRQNANNEQEHMRFTNETLSVAPKLELSIIISKARRYIMGFKNN